MPPRPARRDSRLDARGRTGQRDVRRAILDATEGLLTEHRFDEIHVAAILRAAGVSRASFYFYNTTQEIDRFVEVLGEIQNFFGV